MLDENAIPNGLDEDDARELLESKSDGSKKSLMTFIAQTGSISAVRTFIASTKLLFPDKAKDIDQIALDQDKERKEWDELLADPGVSDHDVNVRLFQLNYDIFVRIGELIKSGT